MERKTFMQIFVILIAVTFVIGMFNYSEKEDIKKKTGVQGTNTGIENSSAAEGVAKGKLQSYDNVIYLSPWNESYRAILETLKSEKQIDYINTVGGVGVITLVPKANLSYIREKLEDIDSDVFSDATLIFDDSINFTFLNGTTKQMNIGSTVAKLDPSTPIGELIDANILADLSQTDVKNIKITLKPKVTNITKEIELECTNSYQIGGEIAWANRETDTSIYASLLNTSESNIIYQKDGSVGLLRKLNGTEMDELRNRNLTFLMYVLEDTIYVNTTNKEEIENALSYLGTGFIYPASKLNATFEANESEISNMLNELGKTIESIKMERNCAADLKKVSMNEVSYYVERNAMKSEQYFDIAKAFDGNKNATIEVYSIGRSITEFILLDIQ